ncbi:hypothetical protein [Streptomyces sp. NPDC055992]|uniref:hypothetical protein n=1 Tax=Streptomyces sp. NPDC055992 TaxID=3345673 RepID=UPI0035DCD01E
MSPPDAVALVRQSGLIVSIATPITPPLDAGVRAMHMVACHDVAGLEALVELESGRAEVADQPTRPSGTCA